MVVSSSDTSGPAPFLLSSALSGQTPVKSSAQLLASAAQDGTQLNPENQNALLKQLLSSTPSQKSNSETSPVKTGFSLEAQLDQPTDSSETYKNLPKEALSSLASQLPNPQAQQQSQAGPTGVTQTQAGSLTPALTNTASYPGTAPPPSPPTRGQP